MGNSRKNNKPLVALVAVLVVLVIGGTFAYFTSEASFENVFKTKPYKTEITETFESPDNWTPGTTTNKTVVAKNTGDVEVAVRVSYTETWKDASGTPLALKDTNDNLVAIVNFADDLDTKWTKSTEGGTDYYYYKTKLAKDESTTSFIKSVTFNPEVAIPTTTSDPVVDDDAHTTTITTTTSGYAGGTYTLTIKVETVQADQYKAAWGTEVEIN